MSFSQDQRLSDWQVMNDIIYGEVNGRCRDLTDMLIMMHCEFSLCSESHRKDKKEDVYLSIANIFMWLLAFCNRSKIDLQETVIERYKACPWCRKTPCECSDQKIESKTNLDSNLSFGFENLKELQEHLNILYGEKNKQKSIIDHLSHISEEIGEISAALILKDWIKVKKECADLLAWLIAYCNWHEVSFQKIAWKRYPGVCAKCQQPFCICPQPVVHRRP